MIYRPPRFCTNVSRARNVVVMIPLRNFTAVIFVKGMIPRTPTVSGLKDLLNFLKYLVSFGFLPVTNVHDFSTFIEYELHIPII